MIKPIDIINARKRDDIEINIIPVSSISVMFAIDGGGYVINVSRDLPPMVIKYYVFDNIAQILLGGTNHYFGFGVNRSDILALETYIHLGFDTNIIKNYPLFKNKIQNKEFAKLLEKGGLND